MTVTPAEYQRFREHGGVADLSARAKFRLHGADRVRYLNGQVTANVTQLVPGAVAPACITTSKGKLCGDIFITAQPNALLIDAEPELRQELAARLEKYIIADEVALEDVTERYALFHWLGAEPPPEFRENLASAEVRPATPADHRELAALHEHAGKVNRFGMVGRDAWIPLGAGAPPMLPAAAPLSPELLELLRIEAGLPRWGRELGRDTLPPEAGLDRTHIDYHKGCYIGQETISRLRSVGHVNRQLTGFLGLTEHPLAPGMRIFAAGDAADARPLGQLTSAAWSFALSKPIALGYLRRGSPSSGLVARPAHADEPEREIAPRALPFLQS